MAESPPKNVSETAANMALIRALESVKPAHVRLFTDPFAERFLPRWQRTLMQPARLPLWRRLLERIFDGKAPGARTSGAARTRLIDDWTREAVRDGVKQAVILGAGFDCRALRLPELHVTSVLELDRGEMVALKSRILADASPLHVSRIAIDFRTQSLGHCLRESGYRALERTLFIWEGVTNYLHRTSVDATFETFSKAASGSRIVFTYVHADALLGTFPARGLERLLARMRRIGEAWTFGFRPEEVPQYLETRGYRLIEDVGADKYRRRYWITGEALEGYEFYRAVLAEKIDGPRQIGAEGSRAKESGKLI